jgi:hypothetical protein
MLDVAERFQLQEIFYLENRVLLATLRLLQRDVTVASKVLMGDGQLVENVQ